MSMRKSVRITIDLPPLADLLSSLALGWRTEWKGGRQEGWKEKWGRHGDDHGSSRDRDAERFREDRELTLPVTGDTLTVGGKNGPIQVTGWDRDEIHIRAEVEAWGASESEAQALAERIEIETDDGPGVVARGPEGDEDSDWSVSYQIQVPLEIGLDLKTSNGSISITDVRGKICFEGRNGAVSLTDLAGDVRGRTRNGRIDLRLTGETWEGSGLDIETNNGGITFKIPENYSAELETGTLNGRIVLGFPLEVEGSLGRRLRTTLGGGGPRLRAVTSNGKVRIERP